MIALAAVEERLQEAFPGNSHVVLAVPDERRGEQLILLTTAHIKRDDIVEKFKQAGLAELMIPRRFFVVKEIPVLPTGKTDFVSAKAIIDALMNEAAA